MSVTFNSTNLESTFIISNVRRPLPEFRATSTRIDGADGEAFEAWAVNKSQQGLQDAARVLTALFSVREPKALQFSDEKDPAANQLTRYAVPRGSFDSEAFIRAGMWECRFVSYDPFLYGIAKTESLVANTEKEIAFGTTVDGRMKAPALVKATSTPTGSYYTLACGDDYVKYEATFNSNTLVLDFEAQTATLTPAVSGAGGLTFGSSFFPLSGTKTLLATANTTLQWTERWF